MMKILLRGCLLYSLIAMAAASATAQMPKSRWARLGEVNLQYLELGGGGQALIFVHGRNCTADFWRDSIAEFPGRRVIALDLPGHGLSDKPKIDYTMRLFADAIEAVMIDAGIDKAVLVGHSMGTPVIREFYRMHPAKTLALVMVDGLLRPPLPIKKLREDFAPLRSDYANVAPRLVAEGIAPIKDADLRNTVSAYMLLTPEHVALSELDGMLDAAIWATDKIRVPVLAIMADSPAWKPDEEKFFRSIAPDLEFVRWSGVSHFLMMERPAEFSAQVKSFLADKKLL